MSVLDNIVAPAAKYRPIPFWSWNDKLENEELRQQIRDMHDAGIGGYFMHARGGLQTEYMGQEWFDAVEACLDEGKQQGMISWAYDENGWPSGFGDGKVNGLGIEYQQKYLRLENTTAGAAATAEHTISIMSNGTMIADLKSLPPETPVTRLYFDVNPYYVDTLDANVIRRFINEIYQAYYDRYDAEKRSQLAGFFTDEPQVSRNGIPWSFILEQEYEKKYGEKLLPLLPQLFLNEGDFRRTRYRFWNLVTILFMNNFMKQIYDWCEEHGMQITGHHVLEETYGSQLTSNGAIMPNYQYYHIPGMDWLGRFIMPVTTPVQVASVCAQTGKKQILSETFALCGWNVKFEELKWIFQWQMVHGINLLCQHLEGYSLKGMRKRDYPASLFRHQPWWSEYRRFNDYVTRLGVILAEGEIKVDTLVMHGQSSAWLCFDNEAYKLVEKYFDSLNSLSNLLDSAHVNFHYGDETMIAMHGSTTDGKFVIGRQSYSLVILPQLKNLTRKNVELLTGFAAAGGKILGIRNTIENEPIYLEGEKADLSGLISKVVWYDSESALVEAIRNYTSVCPVVNAGTPEAERNEFKHQVAKVNFTRRSFADFDGAPAEVYYFVNNDLENGFDTDIYLPCAAADIFDPNTGNVTSVYGEEVEPELIRIPHYFVPAGDLVLIGRRFTGIPVRKRGYWRMAPENLKTDFAPVSLNGEYQLEKITENVLTLDYCSFYFDGVKQEDHEYVLVIQDRLLKLRRPVDVEMRFKFETDAGYDLSQPLDLIVEDPSLYTITVNGTAVSNQPHGYLADPAFKRIAIGSCVKHGSNEIILKMHFKQSEKVYKNIEAAAVFESEKNKLSYDMEIETIYLAGQFGVKTPGQFSPLEREAVRYTGATTMTAVPQTVKLDQIEQCSLPFFSGKASLRRTFKVTPGETDGRYLMFTRKMANIATIRINGKQVNSFIWKPFVASLDGIIRAGDNEIEIELTNSLRNMLGPHHLGEGECYVVCPSSFFKEDGVFSQSWGEPLVWNDNYCFVQFGMDNLRIV